MSAWKIVLSVEECDNANCDYERAEEQRVESVSDPGKANNSIDAVLQEFIVDEVKQQVKML